MNEVISNSFTITITKPNTSDDGNVSDKRIIVKDGSFLVTKLGDSITYK